MSRPLRAERYAKTASPTLVAFITQQLHFLSYNEAMEFYNSYVQKLTPTDLALLGCNDRFFLLTGMLNRPDMIHPWLYDRAREVDAQPDGHLDLWARGHGKSSIITFAGAIQELLIDPEIRIGIFGNTKEISRPFLSQIKGELEGNEELKRTYPDVLYSNPRQESPSWSVERGLIVKRKGNPKEATVEAHGLIDAMPTGRHFPLMIFDDIITEKNVTNPEQIAKATERVELADNLGIGNGTRKQMVGTRYCTVAGTRILMADWRHKPIEEVRIGDEIVGWEKSNGKRYLKASKVANIGRHESQPVVRFTFSNGRSVTCTRDHRWWKGPWGSGPEYRWLQSPNSGDRAVDRARRSKLVGQVPNGSRGMSWVYELLTPLDVVQDRDHGWLAGFYDGEGTVRKNTHHPSGSIMLVQTMHNPQVIDETRLVLERTRFQWSETWVEPAPHRNMKFSRCCFHINGGWRERYRFLATVAPSRRERIAETLYGQMMTSRVTVSCEEDAGYADVFWLQTETGNYIAEGFCSSNSFGDTYGQLMDNNVVKPRLFPATEDGTLDGKPVLLTQEAWDEKKRAQRTTISAQMLQNPIGGQENTFNMKWLKPYWVRPLVLNVYIMVDPSKGRSKTSDRTAMAVVGIDSNNNRYLLDGYCHRMQLSERWEKFRGLHKKWSNLPGVQLVKAGLERYGLQSDEEYFEEKMRETGYRFEILELNWTGQVGRQSKQNRVERLEPDFRNGDFFVPAKVWHHEHPNGAKWEWDETQSKLEFTGLRGPHQLERRCQSNGEHYRIFDPLRRVDEDGNLYDLTRVFFTEFGFFPFSPRDDLIDAVSRLYDMDPRPAVTHEKVLVEDFVDS